MPHTVRSTFALLPFHRRERPLYSGVLEYLQHAGQAAPAAEAEAEAELEPLITVFAFEGSKRVPTTADLATPPHVHSPRGSGLPMGSGTEPAQQVRLGSACVQSGAVRRHVSRALLQASFYSQCDGTSDSPTYGMAYKWELPVR